MITLALRACLRAPHRAQPGLQPAVISYNAVVAMLLYAVPRRRQQLFQDGRIRRRLVGGDLHRRDLGRPDGLLKEPADRHGVPAGGDEHVDDLAELVDRAVVELANLPATTLAEVADATEQGIQRVCNSDSLVVGFLAHTGLTLDP
jgi:hypothetical protein